MIPEKSKLHIFETSISPYLYDGLTNRIFKIENTTLDQLKAHEIDEEDIYREILSLSSLDFTGTLDAYLPHKTLYSNSWEEIHKQIKSGMNQLLLEITEKCPLRCQYCIYSGNYKYERKHSAKSMSTEIAEKAIDLFLQHSKDYQGKRMIGFYGGEPLAEWNFIKHCINYASSKTSSNIQFSITTNGYLLGEEKYEFLIKKGVYLYVSLDGPYEIHNRYRLTISGKGSFTRLISNLMKLRKHDIEYFEKKILFLCVVSNYCELPKLREFFNYNDLIKGHLLISSPIGNPDPSLPTTECISTLFDARALAEEQSEYCRAIINGYPPRNVFRYSFDQTIRRIYERKIGSPINHIHPNGICIPGVKRLYVRTDGSFHPCERVGNSFPIGSVYKGVQYSQITEMMADYIDLCNSTCLNCWASNFCSACYRNIESRRGEGFIRKANTCNYIKAEVHDALVMYSTIMEQNPLALQHYFGN